MIYYEWTYALKINSTESNDRKGIAMSVQIGVIMDPIESINFKKDTTLAILLAAQNRNCVIFYMRQSDLYARQGTPCASMRPLSVYDDATKWYELGDEQDRELSKLDIILMRKDPPFDLNYIYSTYLLEVAHEKGALVVNNPQSLRDCNEKFFATQFPQCCPPVIVTSASRRLKEFHKEHQDVIFKPLDGMGGSSIFRVKKHDTNLNVIIETLTEGGRRQIMAQKYLPEIKSGDKRIILIDGTPIDHCLARIPSIGESRGNLAAGGNGVVQELSIRDRWICEQIGPSLQKKGLIFVGIDVIGDYLTEINVTSPTCVREIDQVVGLDIPGKLIESLLKKLSQR